MEWLVDLGNQIWAWFGVEDNQNRVNAIAAVVAVLLTILGAVLTALWFIGKRLFAKSALPQPPAPSLPTGDVLTMDQHLTILDKREAQLTEKLSGAHQDEKQTLLAQIDELKSRRASPEKSLAEAQKRIKDLEALLEREANTIGGERITEARAALERGDYSVADDIFAEIEVAQEVEVKKAARAAFGRGEIAEAEVRWADAAEHYLRASQLDPSYDNFYRAREFLWRSGEYKAAHDLGNPLIDAALRTNEPEKLAEARNEHALTLHGLGKFSEAKVMFNEVLDLVDKDHPHYPVYLSNLAGVLLDQGRFSEAEDLYDKAIAAVPDAMVDGKRENFAILLGNLARALAGQDRNEEAEHFLEQALEIDAQTVGKRHPSYAVHLICLADVVRSQDRPIEAQELYREALEVGGAVLGEEHPHYAIGLANLGSLIGELGNAEEARVMITDALKVLRECLPENHPFVLKASERLDDLSNAD